VTEESTTASSITDGEQLAARVAKLDSIIFHAGLGGAKQALRRAEHRAAAESEVVNLLMELCDR